MKNRFEIHGDTTIIFLNRKDGTILKTLIDTDDLAIVDGYKGTWFAHRDPKTNYFYPRMTIWDGNRNKAVILHRIIMNAPKGTHVDHINHDTLDNRKSNLRIVTCAQNLQNQLGHKNSKSGIRGVSWSSLHKKWRCHATLNGKSYFLGLFKDIKEAEKIVSKWRKENMPFSEMDH